MYGCRSPPLHLIKRVPRALSPGVLVAPGVAPVSVAQRLCQRLAVLSRHEAERAGASRAVRTCSTGSSAVAARGGGRRHSDSHGKRKSQTVIGPFGFALHSHRVVLFISLWWASAISHADARSISSVTRRRASMRLTRNIVATLVR